MTRRAILQIGTEKTGTTTLQAFLARNRERLLQRGVRYPRFCGDRNHTGLAAYAMDDKKRDALRQGFGVGSKAEIPAFRARLEREAAAELGGDEFVVFCNEHCHSRLTTPAEVERLRALLAPHFDRIDVCVYLRRQDQVALSLYSTRLKSGNTDIEIMPGGDAGDPYFNYDLSLALWEAAFGREHVHVRLFDRSELVDGDIVADFLAAWCLGRVEEFRAVGKMNESITPDAQDYLRRLNAHVEPIPGLPFEAVQGPVASELARLFPGSGSRPARADAEAFYDKFRASNEEVLRRYFPGRDRLFDENFDAYPDAADQTVFDSDTIAAIAARLHLSHIREIRRLEAEIQIREARLAWERDETERCLGALRRAVAHLPDYPESHRALAEYLFRLERWDEAAGPARRAVELRPGRQEYWHFLGVVLRATGDLPGAAAAQERSLELDPGHDASKRALASIRFELKASADRQRAAV